MSVVDDPLAEHPGGVGYSWFRLEIVSYDTFPGTAIVSIEKRQVASNVVSIEQIAEVGVGQLQRARAVISRTRFAASLIQWLQRAVSKIDKRRN